MTVKDVFILALNVERVREIRPARALRAMPSSDASAQPGRALLGRDEIMVRTGSLEDRATRG